MKKCVLNVQGAEVIIVSHEGQDSIFRIGFTDIGRKE